MRTRVKSGPAPIATPADIPGGHLPDDPAVTRMIAAAQRTIDGPSSRWLGRALGKQRLEVWLDGFPCEPVTLMGPVLGSVLVKYLDRDEVEQTVDAAMYRLAGNDLIFRQIFSAPSTICAPDAVRIEYDAGYEAADVPPEAKEAVILMALHAKAVGVENLFLRSEEVEGVGTVQYTVSDQAGAVINKAVESLLSGLRVYT